jgi:hypothetical protein
MKHLFFTLAFIAVFASFSCEKDLDELNEQYYEKVETFGIKILEANSYIPTIGNISPEFSVTDRDLEAFLYARNTKTNAITKHEYHMDKITGQFKSNGYPFEIGFKSEYEVWVEAVPKNDKLTNDSSSLLEYVKNHDILISKRITVTHANNVSIFDVYHKKPLVQVNIMVQGMQDELIPNYKRELELLRLDGNEAFITKKSTNNIFTQTAYVFIDSYDIKGTPKMSYIMNINNEDDSYTCEETLIDFNKTTYLFNQNYIYLMNVILCGDDDKLSWPYNKNLNVNVVENEWTYRK